MKSSTLRRLLAGPILVATLAFAGAATAATYPSPAHDFAHPGSLHPSASTGGLFSPTGGNLDRPMLVVYAQFSDTPFPAGMNATAAATRFFGPFPGVRDYFLNESFGRLDLFPAAETDAAGGGAANGRRRPGLDGERQGVRLRSHAWTRRRHAGRQGDLDGTGAGRHGDEPDHDHPRDRPYGSRDARPVRVRRRRARHLRPDVRRGRHDALPLELVAQAPLGLDHAERRRPRRVRQVPRYSAAGAAYLRYDPDRGTNDYFLVENRFRAPGTYDRSASDNSLVVWRLDDDEYSSGDENVLHARRRRPSGRHARRGQYDHRAGDVTVRWRILGPAGVELDRGVTRRSSISPGETTTIELEGSRRYSDGWVRVSFASG